ncbi:MAG: hypothetical protein VKO21_05665 [Candidatus Sericytochromatia bacterium]|nr:hypothetical protein [Candidatus Sericytochromatia bacterium]
MTALRRGRSVMLALAVAGAAAGCGTFPGAGLTPGAVQGVAAKTAPPAIPAWKKPLVVRDLSAQEQTADLATLVKAGHDFGKTQGAGGLLEYAADNLTSGLANRREVTLAMLFAPPKSFGSVLEVIARDGRIGVYDWGKVKSLQFIQMKAMQGEPVGGIASLEELKNVRETLAQAGLRGSTSGIDSSSVFFSQMPRRKPDSTVEWFPAYVAVVYKGHYAQGKYVLDARSGAVISAPQP